MSYFSPVLLFRAVCETAVLGTMLDRVYAMYMEYSWWTREGPGAGTLDNGYLRSVPLPRVQLVSHMAVPNGTPQTSLIRVPRRHCPLPAALPLFT